MMYRNNDNIGSAGTDLQSYVPMQVIMSPDAGSQMAMSDGGVLDRAGSNPFDITRHTTADAPHTTSPVA
jgi:hypothetical protein